MQATINGEIEILPDNINISELLKSKNIPLNHVAVEVNRKIITKANHSQYSIEDGDVIEIVQFVGGG